MKVTGTVIVISCRTVTPGEGVITGGGLNLVGLRDGEPGLRGHPREASLSICCLDVLPYEGRYHLS
jgi:hypothetical protein